MRCEAKRKLNSLRRRRKKIYSKDYRAERQKVVSKLNGMKQKQ